MEYFLPVFCKVYIQTFVFNYQIEMLQYFFNFWAIPYFIAFLVSIFVAILLILKKQDDKHIQLYTISFLLGIAVTLSAAMATCSLKPDIWNIWNSINSIASVLGATILYHFSYVYFTKKQIFENRKIILSYIPALFIFSFIIITFNQLIEATDYSPLGLFGKVYTGISVIYFPLFYGIIGLFMVLTTINFYKMYKQNKDFILKRQASYFILSSLVVIIGLVITTLLAWYSRFPKLELTIVSLSISGLIIAYSILKHKLFDIEFYVKETFIYLSLTIALIGIFRLIELTVSYYISDVFFEGNLVARLIAAAIVAAIFFPLRNLALKVGNKLFPTFTKSIKSKKQHDLIYKKQLKIAWLDGVITEKEKNMLNNLREEFGISNEEHKNIEKKIIDELKIK